MKPSRVLIHGTGLIGSSIGLGLSAAGWEVWAWDPDPDALAHAAARGALARTAVNPSDGLDSVDLVVLAGPPSATLSTLGDIDTKALITDVASIKQPIVAAGARLARFVAGHPMAGSAASGAHHASGHLFHGAKWVLCNDNASAEDLETIGTLVTSLGATPVLMTAEEHDRSVALVSHLPRVLASLLIQLADEDPQALNVSAGSFRDLTRVAATGSDWWTDVLLGNAAQVESTISALQKALASVSARIAGGERNKIADFLSSTSEIRSHLGAPGVEIRVILFDRPGEIARVGHALAESGVDLRDLQLRHAEHGGGGILTLTVGEGDGAALLRALDADGFEIESGALSPTRPTRR